MIPDENYEELEDDLDSDFEIEADSSLTYAMNISDAGNTFVGRVDADDRIESVEDFTVERIGKRDLFVSFAVVLEQGGKIEIESEVDV